MTFSVLVLGTSYCLATGPVVQGLLVWHYIMQNCFQCPYMYFEHKSIYQWRSLGLLRGCSFPSLLPPSFHWSLSLSPSLHSVSTVDYMDPIPGELTFSSNTSQCFTIAITDDNIFEGLETFSVALSSSDPYLRLASAMQIPAAVNIIDNDGKTISSTLFLPILWSTIWC